MVCMTSSTEVMTCDVLPHQLLLLMTALLLARVALVVVDIMTLVVLRWSDTEALCSVDDVTEYRLTTGDGRDCR